eukprot:350337-Heterocapsa_arctica.AAC.1
MLACKRVHAILPRLREERVTLRIVVCDAAALVLVRAPLRSRRRDATLRPGLHDLVQCAAEVVAG